MTQPNSLKVTKQKLQKFYWPLWFPFPSSWFKALMLAIFMRVIVVVIQNTGEVGYRIAYFTKSSELFLIFTILALLSPIPVISFTHHYLHLFINLFFSEIQAREIGKTQGLLPGLMSWWEGLFGWLVIILSTLIATCISIIFFPLSNLSDVQNWEYYIPFHEKLFFLFSILYIITGALIYQLKYLVKRRIISTYFVIVQASVRKNDTVLQTDDELNQLKAEMGIHTMKSTLRSKEKENLFINNNKSKHNLNKNLVFIVLFALVTIVIYLFFKISTIQNTIPLPLVSKTQTQLLSETPVIQPSPVNSQPPAVLPQNDDFRQAVSKAISAANLTQLAKSQDEWQTVVSEWQAAIALMKTVPSSSNNYVLAQQKIIEYQRNLSYAEKNAVSGK